MASMQLNSEVGSDQGISGEPHETARFAVGRFNHHKENDSKAIVLASRQEISRHNHTLLASALLRRG
jgi:hypothetical protein